MSANIPVAKVHRTTQSKVKGQGSRAITVRGHVHRQAVYYYHSGEKICDQTLVHHTHDEYLFPYLSDWV